MLRAAAAAGMGFLLAVLWFDLMFDVQMRGGGDKDGVESIRRYYRRVTTDARPMNRLVALVMVATLGALAADGAMAPLVLVAIAVLTAATRTVPRAVRVGAGAEGADGARMILREHVLCFVLVGAALVVRLAA